jgi:hypothetical protein
MVTLVAGSTWSRLTVSGSSEFYWLFELPACRDKMRFHDPEGSMRRRDVIAGLSVAALWPLTARAEQPEMPLVGFLSARSPDESTPFVAAFRQGLAEAGAIEGKNFTIEYRWANGDYDRLPDS